MNTKSLLLIGVTTTTATSLLAANNKQQPNVIFILADDMGWSDIGYNDGSKGFYETPFLDQISTTGVRFNNFYPGGPNSAPSRANIITGMSNVRHKIYTPGAYAKGEPAKMRWSVPVRKNGGTPPFQSLTDVPSDVISIAEVVNEVGYRTARIGKWHIGEDTQGFHESSSDGDTNKLLYNDPFATKRIADASLKFIDENRDNPFFLYVPFFDVHTPLVADSEIVAKYKEKWANRKDKSRKFNPVYAAMTQQVDTAVERIFAKLTELGLEENTLVIFGSDNGGVAAITDNAPLRGSKGNLYEGGIRTPAFAVWKGVIKPNSETSTPIHGLDLLPTLAELSGATLPTTQPVDGVSIVPLLKGGKLKSRSLYWHYPFYLTGGNGKGWVGERIFPVYGTTQKYWRSVPASAIQKDGWKLIRFYEYGTTELYYLPDDIGESHNLAKKNPAKVKELNAELDRWLADTKADIPTTENPLFGKGSQTH